MTRFWEFHLSPDTSTSRSLEAGWRLPPTANDIFLFYNVAAEAVAGGIFLYSAYWAYTIRHALTTRLYKNQALGIALIGLSVGFVILTGSALTYVTGNVLTYISGNVIHYLWGQENYIPYAGFFVIYVPVVLGFYAVDASALAARRSDPLLRDTLRWSQARIILWGVTIGGVALNLSSAVYFLLTTGNIPPGGISSTRILAAIQITYTIAPYFVTTVAGALFLPIIVRRSGDETLRKHLQWFELFTIFVLVFYLLIPILLSDPLQILSVQFAGLLAGAYFLYRSAKSLVPLNKLSLSD